MKGKKDKKYLNIILIFFVLSFLILFLFFFIRHIPDSNPLNYSPDSKNISFINNLSKYNYKLSELFFNKNNLLKKVDLRNFESLSIELDKKYNLKYNKNNTNNSFLFLADKKHIIKNLNSLYQNINLNKNLNNTNTYLDQLLNLSPSDPFYLYTHKKVGFAQAYYIIKKEDSMDPTFFSFIGDRFIVRYIFIMDSKYLKDQNPEKALSKFKKKLNNLVLTYQDYNNKTYTFIVDFPQDLFQKIFYSQGAVR